MHYANAAHIAVDTRKYIKNLWDTLENAQDRRCAEGVLNESVYMMMNGWLNPTLTKETCIN